MNEFVSALIGGLVGGIVGVVGTIVSAYYGPRKLEEWQQEQIDKRTNGPRKKLLLKMLEDERFPDGRKLETLCQVTGCSDDDCRRLLI